MNHMTKLFLAISFLSTPALAKTYSCSIDSSDAWADEDAVYDSWTATVDLSTKKVKLYSVNEIFGPNPFAVLTLSNPRGYGEGVVVFRGKNKYRKSHTYTVSFNPEEGSGIEIKEGRNQPLVMQSMDCRRIK